MLLKSQKQIGSLKLSDEWGHSKTKLNHRAEITKSNDQSLSPKVTVKASQYLIFTQARQCANLQV